MTQNQKYLRATGPVGAEIEDSYVILDVDTAKYYAFNPTAKDVWDLLETPKTLGEVSQFLLRQYDVEADVCRKAVEDIVGQLRASGLVSAV